MTGPLAAAQKQVDSLRAFARGPASLGLNDVVKPAAERCGLCAVDVPERHPHLWDTAAAQLHCACEACALLFSGRDDLRYRLVQTRAEYWPDFRLSDAAWDALAIPIDLAFFVKRGADGQVAALYPSPAGVTESLLTLDAWESLEASNPRMVDLAPDVEALLVHRARGARDCFRASIDECYRLAGVLRKHCGDSRAGSSCGRKSRGSSPS